MMSQYIGLDKFKHIYVVDLCHSLCEVARKKAKTKGWKNVTVIEGDACRFQPPEGMATLVTFSYSLSSECSSRGRWRAPQQGSHRAAPNQTGLTHSYRRRVLRLAAATCLLQHHPTRFCPCSDPTLPQRRGQCHQHAGAGRLPGRDRLLRQLQVRPAHAPDDVGQALLLEVRSQAHSLADPACLHHQGNSVSSHKYMAGVCTCPVSYWPPSSAFLFHHISC